MRRSLHLVSVFARLWCPVLGHRQTIKVIVVRNDLDPEQEEDGGTKCVCGRRKTKPQAPK
jgi:hypothetical protein